MRTRRVIAVACTLAMAVTACGELPTAGMEGGHGYGSGNRAAVSPSTGAHTGRSLVAAGGFTAGSGNLLADSAAISAVPGTDTTGDAGVLQERGGYTYGSGN